MTKRAFSLLTIFALSLVCFELAPPTGIAPAYAASKQGVSKPVGKLLQEAIDLTKQAKWAEALAKTKEAQALPSTTPYDNLKINDVLAMIYVNTQDYKNAAAASEAAYASGLAPPEEKGQRLKGLVQLFYQIGDRPKALQYASQYSSEVGDDLEIISIVADSYRLQGDNAKALSTAQDLIAKAKLMGTPIQETWWRVLLACASGAQNSDVQLTALMGLAEGFPTKENWHDLTAVLYNQPSRTDHYGLLALRLMQSSDSIMKADEYARIAQLALGAGLGGEAKKAIAEGEAKGLLPGDMKQLISSLKTEANILTKNEPGSLDAKDAQAAAGKSGGSDVAIGEAYAIYGLVDKAAASINRGLGKTMRTPDEGRLALGWAYFINGKMSEAKTAFESVKTDPRSTKLASAWLVLVKQKTSPAPAPAQPATNNN